MALLRQVDTDLGVLMYYQSGSLVVLSTEAVQAFLALDEKDFGCFKKYLAGKLARRVREAFLLKMLAMGRFNAIARISIALSGLEVKWSIMKEDKHEV